MAVWCVLIGVAPGRLITSGGRDDGPGTSAEISAWFEDGVVE